MEPGDAPLAALPGMVVIALMVAAALVLCAKLAPHDRPASVQRPWIFSLGRLRVPALLFAAVMFLLLVAVPLGNLLYKAGVLVTQTDVGRVRSWSPWKCLTIMLHAPWRNAREFGWSLLIGPCAAAGGRRWPRSRWRGWPAAAASALPVLAVTAACLAVPGPVLGLLVIGLLNRPEHALARGALRPFDPGALAGLVDSRLPAATLILWHAFRTIPSGAAGKRRDGRPPGRWAGCGTSSCRCGSPRLPWPGWWHWPWPWAIWRPVFSSLPPGVATIVDAPVRPAALRRRGPGGGDELGPAGAVSPGGRRGDVVVVPMGRGSETRRMV